MLPALVIAAACLALCQAAERCVVVEGRARCALDRKLTEHTLVDLMDRDRECGCRDAFVSELINITLLLAIDRPGTYGLFQAK